MSHAKNYYFHDTGLLKKYCQNFLNYKKMKTVYIFLRMRILFFEMRFSTFARNHLHYAFRGIIYLSAALIFTFLGFHNSGFAQNPSLEFAAGGASTTAVGPSIAAQVITFQRNSNNPTGTTFATQTPVKTATFSLINQQETMSVPPGVGVVFGATSTNTAPTISSWEHYPHLGSIGGSVAANFMSWAGTPTPGNEGLSTTLNHAVEIFNSVRPLYERNAPLPTTGSPVSYRTADLVITFNTPVTNPILHFAGLGGRIGTTYPGITTDLVLISSGMSLTRLSGSPEFLVPNATDIRNGAESYNGTAGAGSASGSVRVNGVNITSVTFRLFLTAQVAPVNNLWSTNGNNYHSGDAFLVSVSLGESDLAVNKTVNVTNATIGQNVQFTVTATNNGPSHNTGVTVQDLLPNGYTYVSHTATNGSGTYNTGTGMWNIGALNAGVTQTLTITGTVLKTGNHINTAVITTSSGIGDPNLLNNTASIAPAVLCAISAFNPDSDGDGISNACDDDDDNDGVLDSQECPPTNVFASYNSTTITNAPPTTTAAGISFGTVTGVLKRDNFGVTISVPMATGTSDLSNSAVFTPVGGTGQSVLMEEITGFNGTSNFVRYTLDLDTPVESITLHIVGWDYMRARFTGTHVERLLSGGTELVYNPATRLLYDNSPATTSTITRDGFGSIKVSSVDGLPFSKIVFERFDDPNTTGVSDGFRFTFSVESACDADGDGIPNRLELDSDNDGCSDANEFYSSENADGGDGGRYGTGTPAINAATGRVTAASYTGNYTNAATATRINISTQPANSSTYESSDATFTVVAEGTNATTFTGGTPNYTIPPATNANAGLIYRWQSSVDGGTVWTDIDNGGQYSGATTATLTVSSVTLSENGHRFRVIISHSSKICSMTSGSARLFVLNDQPTAVATSPSSQPNPGGTNTVVITNNFGGTDTNGGSIASLTILSFPTNVASITIGSTTYTSTGDGGTTAWPVSGMTLSTNSSGVPYEAISIDPVNGGVTVGIPFTVTDNAGLSSVGTILNVPFAETYSIAGNVFNDNDGTTGNADGGEIDGTPAGLDLVVNLYDGDGNFISSTPVLADGSYVLTDVPAGMGYQVQLNTAANTGQSGENISANPTNLDGLFEHVSSSDNVTPTDGINVVNVSADVAGLNFGINEPPTSVATSPSSQPNPGGTNSVVVTNNFGGTDTNSGSISSLTITSFPDNATSITIGVTTYTLTGDGGSTAWPVSGMTLSTNSSGVPYEAISIDPVNGGVTVGIPFTVTDNAGLSSTGVTLSVPFAETYSIAGNVYNDNDGATGNANGGVIDGTATGLNLVVNLYDEDGNFVTSAPVLSDGSYTLSNVPAGTRYQVQLNTVVGQTGENISDNVTDLPGLFEHVSSSDNVDPTDGINIMDVAANVTGSNFGINETPTAVAGTIASTPNPGGSTSVVITGSFGGTDTNGGSVASLTITSFPSNATSITIAGITYTPTGVGGTTAWPAPGVTVPTSASGVPTSAVSVDPVNGGVTVGIPFTVTDNAGLSSTGVTLSVPFAETYSIAGNVYNDNDGATGNANGGVIDGTATGLDLVVNLYDEDGNFVTSAPVQSDGSYMLTDVASGTGYQVQLNTVVGQAGENISDNVTDLPDLFEHVSSSDNVDPTDGINIMDVAANVTSSNFGINEIPTAVPAPFASQPNPGGNLNVMITNGFGGTDPNGGIITHITVVNFPTYVTSITLGGITYTIDGSGVGVIWPTSGVTVPTNASGLPNDVISFDPDDETVEVTISFRVRDNAGLNSLSQKMIIPFDPTYSVTGNVFNDNDGATGNANGGVIDGSATGLNLVVNLYDEDGNFLTSAPVLSDGSYTLSNVPAGTGYQVQLNTATNVGQTGENISDNVTDLPGLFEHVSSSDNVDPTDGINIMDIAANVTSSNFGINETPTAVAGTIASTPNPGGSTSVVITGSFGGTDPNSGSITSMRITSFPTNATSITIGGITYTIAGGDGATAWPGSVMVPTNTSGVPSQSISVDPTGNGTIVVEVPFTVTDNAGLTSISKVVQVPFTPSLPVTLISFTVDKEVQSSVLLWTTSEEVNSDRFEVEHRGEAQKWQQVGTIMASGDSKLVRNYRFLHPEPVRGVNYYRLKMVDIDGTVAYSRIRSVDFDANLQASVYPNPASDKIRIKLAGAVAGEVSKVKIYNFNGEEVYTANGIMQDEIDVSNLTSGAYVVSISLKNGTTQNLKIVVVR
jgi:hypothetical protein